MSRQYRSKPYFLPVARAPSISKIPLVTARPVSVVTTLTCATVAATSPRRWAVMTARRDECAWFPFVSPLLFAETLSGAWKLEDVEIVYGGFGPAALLPGCAFAR